MLSRPLRAHSVTPVIISIIGGVAFFAVLVSGVRQTFGWVYLPTLMLVPARAVFDLPGLPDLTPSRAAAIGLVVGAVAIGQGRRLLPNWRRIDLLAIIPIFSFAVSYWQVTDFKGFYHRLPVLALDWGCPYLFARAMITDTAALRAVLRPFAIFACATAFLAVYESRMAFRLAPFLWNAIGVELKPIGHYGSWRWGFLRAQATFGGPIEMGTFFAMAAPLALLWGILDPRRKWVSRGAALFCAAGCIASLSRGPILVLIAVTVAFWIIAKRRRYIVPVALVLFACSAPFLVETATEEVRYTSARLEATGNTADESGHYRVALLLIYGEEIADVGWWGDPYLVGQEYEAASSIDNAYLYLFLIGGWIGGGSICLLILLLYIRSALALLRSSTPYRPVLAALIAGFVGITGAMGNVWFANDYAPFFWLTCALLLNACAINRSPVRDFSSPRRAGLPETAFCLEPLPRIARDVC